MERSEVIAVVVRYPTGELLILGQQGDQGDASRLTSVPGQMLDEADLRENDRHHPDRPEHVLDVPLSLQDVLEGPHRSVVDRTIAGHDSGQALPVALPRGRGKRGESGAEVGVP